VPISELTFHHLGVACTSIADEVPVWSQLGYKLECDPFVDEAQGIRALFMTGGGPRVELIEGLEGSTTLTPWLKRRVKLYHMGYFTADFERSMAALAADGGTMTREPAPSVYFGKRICFFMLSNLSLVELIEAP
jgi:methylmalonyl-CoA/ethylmalonyl-CoA epimerase